MSLVVLAIGCSDPDQVKRDAEKTAQSVSDSVRFIKIQPLAPQLNDASPAASFVLTLSATPSTEDYFFGLKEYWIETGDDPERQPTRDICNVISRAYNADTLALARYLSEAEINAGFGIGALDVSLGLKIELAELLRSLDRFARIKNSHALIAIKGYADGQVGQWREFLNPEFPFRRIAYRTAIRTQRYGPASYSARDTVIEINQYDNNLLPNLRAEFIRQALVLPFLDQCADTFNPEVIVLDGYTFKAPLHPENRKVQVFVYIIPDE